MKDDRRLWHSHTHRKVIAEDEIRYTWHMNAKYSSSISNYSRNKKRNLPVQSDIGIEFSSGNTLSAAEALSHSSNRLYQRHGIPPVTAGARNRESQFLGAYDR